MTGKYLPKISLTNNTEKADGANPMAAYILPMSGFNWFSDICKAR
jgi:hypothetical protein